MIYKNLIHNLDLLHFYFVFHYGILDNQMEIIIFEYNMDTNYKLKIHSSFHTKSTRNIVFFFYFRRKSK